MKSLIFKNIIGLAVATCGCMLAAIVALGIYNKTLLIKANTAALNAEEIEKYTNGIHHNGLSDVDKSLRAYAITKAEQPIKYYQIAKKSGYDYCATVEKLLQAQKAEHPQYGPSIDSSLHNLKILVDSLRTYYVFTDNIAGFVKNDSFSIVRSMIAEDRGFGPWTMWYNLYKNTQRIDGYIVSEAQQTYQAGNNTLNWLVVLLVLIGIPTAFWTSGKLKKAEKNRKQLLSELDTNNREYLFDNGTGDGQQNDKQIIGNSIGQLKIASGFVSGLSEGNLEIAWEGYNEQNHAANTDNLAGKLIKLRETLKTIKNEDEKRFWVNEGLAQFSVLLRNNQDSLEKLSQEAARFLTKYLNAQQGGLFIIKNETGTTPHLELVSCYAFDKKKYMEKKMEPGDGLIGQAYLEKETILLTEIPDGYTYITSGLGHATPTCILIVPIKYNDFVEGIMELAGFHVFSGYQIAFLEKAGEFIASAITTAKSAENTARLLQQSKQVSEEMQAQEEELRQNMEELAATQEQMQKSIDESNKLKKAIDKEFKVRETVFAYTTILSEANEYGAITYVNDKLCEISKYSREELIGKNHNIFRHPDTPKELFTKFWKTIKDGKVFNAIIKNRAKDGSHYWVDATIVPVKNENGEFDRYVGARYHIKDDTIAEQMYEKQAIELALYAMAGEQ